MHSIQNVGNKIKLFIRKLIRMIFCEINCMDACTSAHSDEYLVNY